jgi:ABC-type transport system involved in cytochrome bd biosynthesis fused ATPase/permease subunit
LDNKEDKTMEKDHNQTSQATKKISNYLTMIVLIVVALSIVSLILAANAYVANPNDIAPVAFLAIIGLVALTMSVFTLYQSKRQVAQMKIEIPKVMTTIECKCGSKSVREFQRGDYVYKELDVPCQKCPNSRQVITAIYKEVKEKEKTYNV